MTSNSPVKARKRRRLLSPSEKYEMYVAVLTGQCTQREAAEKWRVDRSTVTTICRTAKQGARSAVGPARPVGRGGRVGGGAGGGRAAARHGDRAGGRATPARGKTALGLTAGPVPVRVDACVKAGLLDLIEQTVERDWSARRACDRLWLEHGRYQAWLVRQAAGRLDDLPPGGNPLHGILPAERAAIVE